MTNFSANLAPNIDMGITRKVQIGFRPQPMQDHEADKRGGTWRQNPVGFPTYLDRMRDWKLGKRSYASNKKHILWHVP